MLIGCVPNSADFAHPADRRRYLFYFSEKSLQYETANFDKHYDYVYISISGDLNKWCNYKKSQLASGKKVKVIFDLSDFYFGASFASDFLRSIYHFLARRTLSLKLSYKRTLLNMMKETDVLLCGSDEQKNFLDKYHNNVVVMRDYYGLDIRSKKESYQLRKNNEINILWEGFAHGSIRIFEMLRKILESIDGYDVNLHVITDSVYCRFGASHICQPTYAVLKKIFSRSRVKFHLYDWNSITFSSIASSCDFALIPIPNDPILVNKPENKLLLLWSIGLPVITSKTRAYFRVMMVAGDDWTCSTDLEWHDKITMLASSEAKRVEHITFAQNYLSRFCSKDVLLSDWDRVFT